MPKNTSTLPRQPKLPHVFTIAAEEPFAAALVRGLKARFGADPAVVAQATIFLPTRRAVRTLAEAFAAEAGGAALLPDLKPLGADEDEAFFAPADEDLTLPPAIAPERRVLLLASLVRRWNLNRDGGSVSFVQTLAMADSLAAIMDEIEIAGADWNALQDLAPADLAEHWAAVKDFLLHIHAQWPTLLQIEGCMEPAARRNRTLEAQARRFAAGIDGLGHVRPAIAAGSTGSIPATADLMAAIANCPMGAVVLPGLDQTLDDASWDRLEPGHPQYGLKKLLERLGVARGDVAPWVETPIDPRRKLLAETLRPAPTTDAWRAIAEDSTAKAQMAAGLKALTLIRAADSTEEAEIAALALRETLETPGRTAALVTRDRALARRVATACRRWGIEIDDSAGTPLSHTPPGTFLVLLAEAATEPAPVSLLALLKHPLSGPADESERANFRRMARRLDLALRGPRPDSGLAGLAEQLDRHALETKPADEALAPWFAGIRDLLEPLETLLKAPQIDLAQALETWLAAALALSDPERLWRGPAGEAAFSQTEALRAAAGGLPAIEGTAFAPLLGHMFGKKAVHAFGHHPRLAILGPLEARLQRFDRTILSGLNEGSWPAGAPSDPWFSRPMREALGLEQPERAIGLAAHDFEILAAGGGDGSDVILTRAAKADGAPTVACRWLQRLEQLTAGLGLADRLTPLVPYGDIARALNDPGVPTPMAAPAPTPPIAARPRRLSVTEIETWLRDPYAIYAKHVLHLRPLDPLQAEIGPMERGSILHKALEIFTRRHPGPLPPDAGAALIAIADELFAQARTPKATMALWRPRFIRAAYWFVEQERHRRPNVAETFVEISGKIDIGAPAGNFTLVGKADRIDRLKGGGAAILDYKTGTPPSNKQVEILLTPQLPLEGAILSLGGFSEVGVLEPAALEYIRIGGGSAPGEVKPLGGDVKFLSQQALENLTARVARFDDPATAYSARVAPQFARTGGDYDHLARVAEWSVGGWSGE